MSLQCLFDHDHCMIFSVREIFVPKTSAKIPNFWTLLKLMYLVKWHRCMALLYKDVMLDHVNKLIGVYTCIGNLWSLHIWYLRCCFWWYIICYVDANNLDICLFYWLFFSEFFVDLLCCNINRIYNFGYDYLHNDHPVQIIHIWSSSQTCNFCW